MYSIGLPRNGVLLQMRRGLQFFKKTHGHLRRRRPPATDTTSRLRFALPRENRSQDDWAAIFVPCAVYRFSGDGHVDGYAHSFGLARGAHSIFFGTGGYAGTVRNAAAAPWI